MNPRERAEVQQAMCRLADGDRSAFTQVYSAAWPILRRFAERMLSSAADAEDAAQRAMLKIVAQAVDFDAERDALGWMLALTAFECQTSRRARERRRETGEIPELSSVMTPEDEMMRAQLMSCASEALGELGAGDLEALEAAYAGRTPNDVSRGTFRKRVQRAVNRLQIALRLKHGD